MSRTLLASLLSSMFALTFVMPAAAQAPATPGQNIRQEMQKFRDDLQTAEAQLIAKNVALDATEAAAFWPLFKAFQAEQRKIIDGQVTAVGTYADKYSTLTDADVTAYVNALLARDQQIHDLRVKYLKEYSRVIGPRRAARVIHVSRKIGTQSQAKLAEVIPVVP